MTDETPAPAPVSAPVKPRAPLELNVICLGGIIILGVADAVALGCGVSIGAITMASSPVLTGLFAVINRSPTQ